MSEMSYLGCDGTLRVAIAADVVSMISRHRQLRFWQSEKGGLLFASTIGADDGRAEIVDASPPHPRDRGGRTWLKLNYQRCLDEIRDRFARGWHFVGYWHTHPERDPHLSTQDAIALQPLLSDPGIDLDRLVMIVAGGTQQQLAVDVAILDRRTGRIESMVRQRGIDQSTDPAVLAGS